MITNAHAVHSRPSCNPENIIAAQRASTKCFDLNGLCIRNIKLKCFLICLVYSVEKMKMMIK